MSDHYTVVTAQFREIWVFIEEKMQIKVPPYMTHISEACGYDNYCSIASIEETDIDIITSLYKYGLNRVRRNT